MTVFPVDFASCGYYRIFIASEVPTFPFLAFLVPGCNRQAEESREELTGG